MYVKTCFRTLGFSLVQSLSRVLLSATSWTAECQASLSITSSWKDAQTHVHWVGDAIQPLHPLLSPSPSTFSPSQHQGLFQWVSSSHQVAKVLEVQLQISPSNEYSVLISFRTDLFALLAIQGTLKSLLQCHSSEASIQLSLESQFSHPYMTTGKTMALTRQTFVGKVMSLYFKMLSRLVITFLPMSKHLLIPWLQVTICSDFGAQENPLGQNVTEWNKISQLIIFKKISQSLALYAP